MIEDVTELAPKMPIKSVKLERDRVIIHDMADHIWCVIVAPDGHPLIYSLGIAERE